MPSSVNLKAIGLNISPNSLELPPGSLIEATNVIIRRDSVVEPRRGFKLFGNSFGTIADTLKQLISYKQRLLRHYNNILQFDSTGAGDFLSFAGNYTETQTGLRIKSIESNGNLYFTSSAGIKKISAKTAADFTTASGYITQAGAPKAIDFTLSLSKPSSTQTGFLPQDSAVAYRHLWGTRDENSNLILGTPSQAEIIYNSLLGLLIPDYMNLLEALDNIRANPATSSFFTFGQYVNTYKVDANTPADTLRSEAIALVTQIDNDIIFADQTAGTPPLQISPVPTISSGVCTITFSSGTATNYFSVGDKIYLAGFTPTTGTLDGAQTVSVVTGTTIKFNTTAIGPVSTLFATIVSNKYRSITQPAAPSDPATNDQLVAIQSYINSIITNLQQETNFIIPTLLLTEYITPLSITQTSNVRLDIDIPDDVTSNYFLQIYRGNISEATGTTVLTDLTPNDEMQLVYEAYPTSAELAAGIMTVIDITPDIFKGANLYTNQATGEGILQANDVPPFANDINRFKNVIFYANTQTRYRLTPFNLLGVSNMISDYNAGTIPTITIADGVTNNTYTFIIGIEEVTDITTISKASMSASAYFDINSADNTNLYRIWYNKTGADPAPASGGRTLVEIDTSSSLISTATDIAKKTRDVLSGLVDSFMAFSSTNTVTVTNVDVGYTTDASAGTSGFTINVTTQGQGESASNKQVLLSQLTSVAQAVDETSRSLIRVINQNSSEDIYAFYLSGPGQVPGKMYLEGRALSSNPFYIIANNTNTGQSFNPDISPDVIISAVGAISVANPTVLTSPAHGLINQQQIIITGSNSTPSINGIYTVTVTGANTFTIPVNVTAVPSPAKFSYSKLSNTTVAQNEVKPNRIYYSKVQQPEAVPITNYLDVGAEDKAILRIFPLRDSLFVFKEDGLFRISGETAPFYLSLFDSSCILIAADSISVSNNLIYGWTRQGISTISEAGVVTISRPIDTEILKLASSDYTYFSTATWGVGYESDNSYIVYTIKQITDILATVAYRYSNLTNSWTVFNKTDTCGLINPADDKLYMGAGDRNYIEQERKSFTRLDYADREITTEIQNNLYQNDTIQLTSVSDYEAGDVVVQTQGLTNYTYNMLLRKLDIDPGIAIVNITAISVLGLVLTITANNHNLSSSNLDYVTIADNTSTPSFNGTYLTTYVDVNNFKITVAAPVSNLVIDGTARLSYYNSLRAVAGNNLRTKIIQLAAKLDTDPNTSLSNYSTLIASITASITAISQTNPTIITSVAHGLVSNRQIVISGSNSSPSINGTYQVSVINANTFTIPVNVITAGTTGSFVTDNQSFNDIRACYNAIIGNLNIDNGVAYDNYVTSTIDTLLESVIIDVNKNTKKITILTSLEFVVGPIVIFKAIHSSFTYAPNTMGDPLGLKHVYEATMMFANKAFTNATMSFSSDLLPAFQDVPFDGDGNGIFGTPEFGGNFFGGDSHPVPFRTLIPRSVQRCRYLLFKFKHMVAREKYSAYGCTITGEIGLSARAYK